MAITASCITFWRKLKELGALPTDRPDILEIGEGNWFGDVDPVNVPEFQGGKVPADPFMSGKLWYCIMLNPKTFSAIDLQGTKYATRHDLNKPLFGHRTFDIIINSGTAEHVFNQAQLFTTIHDCCKAGGLMVHCAPVGDGWQGHGLYVYGDEFFADLAAANEYEVVAADRLPMPGSNVTALYTALRKVREGPFRAPMQRALFS